MSIVIWLLARSSCVLSRPRKIYPSLNSFYSATYWLITHLMLHPVEPAEDEYDEDDDETVARR